MERPLREHIQTNLLRLMPLSILGVAQLRAELRKYLTMHSVDELVGPFNKAATELTHSALENTGLLPALNYVSHKYKEPESFHFTYEAAEGALFGATGMIITNALLHFYNKRLAGENAQIKLSTIQQAVIDFASAVSSYYILSQYVGPVIHEKLGTDGPIGIHEIINLLPFIQ